ncbi:MAG: gliding motility-associated C-terminal domain-containing protein [Saprospiraceae bacterium]|nr:gliding motility-associated C-terminal domain-containing protein [Saprospiraceae bacterium]
MKRIIITLTIMSCLGIANAQWVSTVSGIVETPGSNDGDALQARFFFPHGIAADTLGHIFIADRDNHTIRLFDLNSGKVSTLAGKAGQSGNVDGFGSAALFNEPWGICATPDGVAYVADTKNNKIRKVTLDGQVTTFAGTGNFGTSNGLPTASTFGNPTGIERDAEGILFVADHATHIIRKVDKLGNVTTLAGKPYLPGDADGVGSDAEFWRPYGLCIDNDGNVLVADEWNNKIRKITPQGVVTTLAGNGINGSTNGDNAQASFNYPWDVTVDPDGNVYVGDGYNNTIRRIAPNGQVTTLAGTVQVEGTLDGLGTSASFKSVTSLAWSTSDKSIYLTDCYSHTIRKITIGGPDLPALILFNLNGDGEICEGEPLTLQAKPDALGKYRFYMDGVMVQDDNLNEYSTSSLPLGTHSFTVEADFGNQTLISNPIEVTVMATPQPTINAVGPLSFFEGDSVILFATGQGDFLWSNAETTQAITVMESGSYFVEATLGSCTGISAPVAVEVTPLPEVLTVLVQGNNRLCPNGTVVLTSSFASGNQWYHDGWPIGGQFDQTLEVSEPGMYAVQATDPVTGITAISEPVEIMAPVVPNLDFIATPTTAAPGQPVLFKFVGSGQPTAFEWRFGDPSSGLQNNSTLPEPSHIFMAEGSYTIELVATDPSGCKHSLLKPALVNIEQSSNAYLPNAFTPNSDGENDVFRLRGNVDSASSMTIFNQWGELLFQTSSPTTGWDGNRDGRPVAPGTYLYVIRMQVEGKEKEVAGMVTLLR